MRATSSRICISVNFFSSDVHAIYDAWRYVQITRRRTSSTSSVRHPRPVRESSCPTWSFLPVAWFLPDWRFPFLRLRLRSSSPWPPFILSLGRDVSGSAEPVGADYASHTEGGGRGYELVTVSPETWAIIWMKSVDEIIE